MTFPRYHRAVFVSQRDRGIPLDARMATERTGMATMGIRTWDSVGDSPHNRLTDLEEQELQQIEQTQSTQEADA